MKALALASGLLLATSALAAAQAGPISPRHRVAVLVPYLEDALRRLPNEVEIVAAVRRWGMPPPSGATADLGSGHSPNLEHLVAARPDLVLVDGELQARLEPQIRALGLATLVVTQSSLAETAAALELVGRRLGIEAAMRPHVEGLQAAIAGRRVARPGRVLVLLGAPGTFFVATDRSWLGDLVVRLGLENLGATLAEGGSFPGFVPASEEILAGLRPDVILLAVHGDRGEVEAALARKLAGGGAWAEMAKRARAVRVLDPRWTAYNPGLELPRVADEILAALAAGALAEAGSTEARP